MYTKDNKSTSVVDDWPCVHLLRSCRNVALRSTLYVAIFVSFMIVVVFVLRWPNNRLELALPIHSQRNVVTSDTKKIQEQEEQHHGIVILYWTRFFETNDFEVGLGSRPFAPCMAVDVASSCLTTTDRGLLNDSDAVIFHGRDLHANDLPPPGWRRPHQHFIFFLLESPIHTDLAMLQQPVFKNYFNTTMTYRRDSDVVEFHAYGRLRCIDPASCTPLPGNSSGSAVATWANNNSGPVLLANVTTTTTNANAMTSDKNRTVAWFVSNCNSNSQRESLVRKLSQFIAVDIYGKCGSGSHSCPNKIECDKMLSRHYRFYLSFENSLCPDYITEKLYRPLANNAVPVVYGGADYSLYLPPGSYINARDYKSPEDLAHHLKKLMIDDGLYSSYFRWKEKYVVDRTPLDGWCHLCRLLMNRDKYKDKDKDGKSYDDVALWWSGMTTNRTCLSPPQSLVASKK